uniref:Rab9 effector protein with kelch motifs n=1 Tax=Mus musculus TaxID=10090 RepID=D6RHN6_MOUSE
MRGLRQGIMKQLPILEPGDKPRKATWNTPVGHGHQGGPLASVRACQLPSLLLSSQHLGVWRCRPVRKSKLSASHES